MAFDFSPVGLGIGGITSIAGLIAGSKAQKQAQQRRNSIIQQMKDSNAREYLDVMTGNARSLAARTGGLNNALESTGRSLGAANAAAGVTNSSAVSGSLALGQRNIADALTQYALRNRLMEGQINSRNQQNALGLELGAADQDLGTAQGQLEGGIQGFGQFLQGVGQLGGSRQVATASPAALPGQQSSSIMQGSDQFDEAGGRPITFDPITLQSELQRMTQKNRKGLGGFDMRTSGPAMNGMQGYKLPGFG